MMKGAGLIIQQPQQQPQQHVVVVEDNLSNLTSAYSSEAAASVSSSGNKPLKKKRNLPGNPDPDAEVIALSPKSLLATNRFVCDICNKGFQREQNLQLHRRGHNLPWKLKQRASKELIRKKVYVCPEPSCVHHHPSRALGDLTGIKKHFCRKHGEKKWKCDKCSKRYAVRSDLKAHSRTCGTKEYRCDCGTLFSRRDSYMTHKALCNVLVEESARSAMTRNADQFFSSSQAAAAAAAAAASSSASHHLSLREARPQLFDSHGMQAFPLKKEPQWQLGGPGPGPPPPPFHLTSPLIFPASINQDFRNHNQDLAATGHDHSKNPNPTSLAVAFHPSATPHISATALLQKAAQMGATMSSKTSSTAAAAMHQALQDFSEEPHQAHVSAEDDDSSNNNTSSFGLNLSSREGLSSDELVSKAAGIASRSGPAPSSTLLLQHMMTSLSSSSGFGGPLTTFEDAFGGNFIIDPRKDETNPARTSDSHQLISRANEAASNGGNNDGLTRDFLGLRRLSHSDIFNKIAAGISNCINNCSSSGQHQNQDQKPWQ